MTAASKVTAKLTPKSDKKPVVVKLKIFWKTKKHEWSQSDIGGFHKAAPIIAEKLLNEKYWSSRGDIKSSKFTCEDFAIRILCEYAAAYGLPVRLTTGVRTYRNMELYNAAEHDQYSSTPMGFAHMVMKTYGAPDMLSNTKKVSNHKDLISGDIMLRNDDGHVQVVHTASSDKIDIFQGNFPVSLTDAAQRRIIGKIQSIFSNSNPSQDPDGTQYLGQNVQHGVYNKESNNEWSYRNITLNKNKEFDTFKSMGKLLRWDFNQFSK